MIGNDDWTMIGHDWSRIEIDHIHVDDCPSDDWRRVHEHLTNVVQNNNAPFVDDDSRWPCG